MARWGIYTIGINRFNESYCLDKMAFIDNIYKLDLLYYGK